MVDKEEMIEMFEDLYANLKMEVLSNSDDHMTMRQMLGQIQGFFLGMRMTVPLDMEEIQYVEQRLQALEERMR